MSRNDYIERLNQIQEKQNSEAANRPKPVKPKRAIGPIAVLFYGFWGFAFNTALAFANANYDEMMIDARAGGSIDDVLLGLMVFLIVTLGLMALSLLIALVRTLFGWRSAPNWYRLLVFCMGMGVAGLALNMV